MTKLGGITPNDYSLRRFSPTSSLVPLGVTPWETILVIFRVDGLIHMLLDVPIIMIILRIIQGRRPL